MHELKDGYQISQVILEIQVTPVQGGRWFFTFLYRFGDILVVFGSTKL